MSQLGERRAAALASAITRLVDASIGSTELASSDPAMQSLAEELVPLELRNLGALTMGWEAYRQCAVKTLGASPVLTSAQMVCSVPGAFVSEASIAAQLRGTGIWPGSLVASFYEMFNRADRELQIISPYWSSNGIQALLRHVSRSSFAGVRIQVLTQPASELLADGYSALSEFKSFLSARGADVEIASPNSNNYRTFLVHAKVIIQDRAVTYVGSANLTLNGIEHSVEVGAIVQGAQATQLGRWFDIIASGMEIWD